MSFDWPVQAARGQLMRNEELRALATMRQQLINGDWFPGRVVRERVDRVKDNNTTKAKQNKRQKEKKKEKKKTATKVSTTLLRGH